MAAGQAEPKWSDLLLEEKKEAEPKWSDLLLEEKEEAEPKWADLLNKPVTIAGEEKKAPSQEEIYERMKSSKEDKEKWKKPGEVDAAKAAEWYGGVRKGEEEQKEEAVKKSLLSLKPAPVAEIAPDERDLEKAEWPWDRVLLSSRANWNSSDKDHKRKQMRAFTEAFTKIRSDGFSVGFSRTSWTMLLQRIN